MQDVVGSIPARAGKPEYPTPKADEEWVYPRACGGTGNNRLPVAQGQGLSPRVRGNQARPKPGALSSGSIPARAGEPRGEDTRTGNRWVYPRACGPARAGEPHRMPRRSCRNRVYPRACGETAVESVKACIPEGLSPRVRGNLFICPERGLVHDKGYYHSCFGRDAESQLSAIQDS